MRWTRAAYEHININMTTDRSNMTSAGFSVHTFGDFKSFEGFSYKNAYDMQNYEMTFSKMQIF